MPFLRASPETQFHLLALHPVAEADEINAFDAVPRGSLLEWIDNFYTNPATHSERVFGKWANAVPALNLFASVRDQVHFKAFDVEGDSFPQAHGQFHSIPFWSPDAYEVDGLGSFESDWLNKACQRCVDEKSTTDDRPEPW